MRTRKCRTLPTFEVRMLVGCTSITYVHPGAGVLPRMESNEFRCLYIEAESEAACVTWLQEFWPWKDAYLIEVKSYREVS